MGYDDDECAFCYLNGFGNNSVGEYDTICICFACLPRALGMETGRSGNQRMGRLPSELNQLNPIADVSCYCNRRGSITYQLGLRLPCCDRCEERIYAEIDEELGPWSESESDDDYDTDDDGDDDDDVEVDGDGEDIDTQSDNEGQSEPSETLPEEVDE